MVFPLPAAYRMIDLGSTALPELDGGAKRTGRVGETVKQHYAYPQSRHTRHRTDPMIRKGLTSGRDGVGSQIQAPPAP